MEIERVVLKIAVVGGGIVGACIARELAIRRHKVTLLEKGSLGGAVTGASLACLGTHMNSRSEIEILKWSCSAWAELNDELGQTMEYTRCGQLRFIERDEDIDVARDWIGFERGAGLLTELLEPNEVRRIEPLLEGPIIAATWAPNAATVTPFLAVRAILKDAARNGLQIQCHNAVRDFIKRGGTISGMVTQAGAIEADVVILAAGPWTGELTAKIGLNLPILPRKAQCMATVAVSRTIRTVIAACESAGGVAAGYTQIQQAPSGQVLFNTVLGDGLSQAGSQNTVSEVDPVFVCNSIRQLLWLFPSLSEVELLRSWVRYEAVTPDDKFIVGPSSVPGLYIAAGDGGSGFGRAPAIARAVADSLEGCEPPFNAGLWAPSRFLEKIAA
jgi:D-hydroxyproline dehydrogenase subunit beta